MRVSHHNNTRAYCVKGATTTHLLLAFLIALIPHGAIYADTDVPIYEQRNNIFAGDNSFNLIATSGATIIVVQESDGQKRQITRDEYLAFVEKTNPSALKSAKEAIPFSGQRIQEDLAFAQTLFEAKQYSSSAILYQRVIKEIKPSDPSYAVLTGMVTASLFGSARHVEGLRFICEQYKKLPTSDIRYRHAIHAHLRSLAVNLGRDRALEILTGLRRETECQRSDMSPVWISIPLRDMRDLEKSVSPIGGVYGIRDPKDYAFAQEVLAKGGVGFLDYLYFEMGRYEEVIAKFPQSPIYDLALLAAGAKGDYATGKRYLEEYIAKYKSNRVAAIQTLYIRMVDEKDFTSLVALSHAFPSDHLFALPGRGKVYLQVDSTTRVWFSDEYISELSFEQLALITDFYRECRSLQAMVPTKDFPRVIERFRSYGDRYKALFESDVRMNGWYGAENATAYDEQCAFELRGGELLKIADAFWQAKDDILSGVPEKVRSVAQSFKRCGDFRQGLRIGADKDSKVAPYEFCRVLDQVCNDLGDSQAPTTCDAFPLQDIAAQMLEDLHESTFGVPVDLFLAGLARRNSGDYDLFARDMEYFRNVYPNDGFADDAFTELGWYYMVIKDWPLAEETLKEVIANYSESNAYDNAMNFLIELNIELNRFGEAAIWSQKLVREVVSLRLQKAALARDEDVALAAKLSYNADLAVVHVSNGLNYSQDAAGATLRSTVVQVSGVMGPAEAEDLGEFDIIKSVDSVSVGNTLEFYAELSRAVERGQDRVTLEIESWFYNDSTGAGETVLRRASTSLKTFGVQP